MVALAPESLGGYLNACLNVPWMASPVEEMSLTFPDWTWLVNVGLNGICTRAAGCSACDEIHRFRASSPTTSSTSSQRLPPGGRR